MFLIICMFLPISISFFWVDSLLIAMGFDQLTATYAKEYITILLPAILINSLGDSIDLFLISMGFNTVVFVL